MISELESAVADVVDSGNCTGCGACSIVSPRISVDTNDRGFNRPTLKLNMNQGRDADLEQADLFKRVCPGVSQTANTQSSRNSHSILGDYIAAWDGWASDDEVRWAGASGGVLTALSMWLLTTGRVTTVVGAAASVSDPVLTETVVVDSAPDCGTCSGSRYAPVSNMATNAKLDRGSAVVGKPCEASALRRYMDTTNTKPLDRPISLSFFCAGTPSQSATNSLVASLGLSPGDVRSLRYRGNGCPGKFDIQSEDAHRSLSYEESWGAHLGRDVQPRCKICVDATGEDADITVGDHWDAGPDDVPIFDESPGRSVVIARTVRGERLLREATDAGVIELIPVDLDDVVRVQRHQRDRRVTLFGRLIGQKLAGQKTSTYRGYGLWKHFVRHPLSNLRALVSNFLRARGWR